MLNDFPKVKYFTPGFLSTLINSGLDRRSHSRLVDVETKVWLLLRPTNLFSLNVNLFNTPIIIFLSHFFSSISGANNDGQLPESTKFAYITMGTGNALGTAVG